MPELPASGLRTVALSEPVWLDGGIVVAIERLRRDAIDVVRVWPDPVPPLAALPGVPTSDPSEGPRAMWPRLAEFAPGWQCVYQQGERNAWVDSGGEVIDIGATHPGVWPVAVRQDSWLGSQAKQATAGDGSQGIFGWLDGKWWSFDAIRQSNYAAAYPKGVLFHGWRDDKKVLHLLFTEGSASVPDRVILCTDEGGVWNRFVVFEGRAEFPRGCSTPNGVYVHAVGDGGRYRAAMGPFPRVEEPVANISVKSWATFSNGAAAIVATDAARIRKHIQLAGSDHIDTEDQDVGAFGGQSMHTFYKTAPGEYRFWFTALPNGPETSRRAFTVPTPPEPDPVAIEDDELAEAESRVEASERALTAALDDAKRLAMMTYVVARVAGNSIDDSIVAALSTWRAEVREKVSD